MLKQSYHWNLGSPSAGKMGKSYPAAAVEHAVALVEQMNGPIANDAEEVVTDSGSGPDCLVWLEGRIAETELAHAVESDLVVWEWIY
ncbi:hypothetical protein B296_00034431 [Ensete ventricosum]|uniref:Uncharacterized protein n=1 Tax=Ensete ventricosum TaxID=4639 RepID=A0A426YU09_ENSVE|nr:hypothetical protein B296_00034431 [Ensete ventricosum]